MVSAQYIKKYLTNPHQIGAKKQRGVANTEFESHDFDLLFKVTKVFSNGLRSTSEEMFYKVSLNLVHRGTRTRHRPG